MASQQASTRTQAPLSDIQLAFSVASPLSAAAPNNDDDARDVYSFVVCRGRYLMD